MSKKNNDLKSKIKKSSPAVEFLNTFKEEIDNNIHDENNNDDYNEIINNNENNSNDINNSKIVIENENANDNINKNDNVNDNDIINEIVNNKYAKPKKTLTGIYFDPTVEKVLNKLAKKGGKGAKSKIVNELVKEGFKKRGLL